MVSNESLERLRTQKELTAGQKAFLQKALDYYKGFAAEAASDEAGRKLEAAHSFASDSCCRPLASGWRRKRRTGRRQRSTRSWRPTSPPSLDTAGTWPTAKTTWA